jgi:hypothetical protein
MNGFNIYGGVRRNRPGRSRVQFSKIGVPASHVEPLLSGFHLLSHSRLFEAYVFQKPASSCIIRFKFIGRILFRLYSQAFN